MAIYIQGRDIIYHAYSNSETKSILIQAIEEYRQNNIDVNDKIKNFASKIVLDGNSGKLHFVSYYLATKYLKIREKRNTFKAKVFAEDPLEDLFKKISSPLEGTFLSKIEKEKKIKLKYLLKINASPLIIACANNQLDNVKKLLDQRENPNIPDSCGSFPLHWAAAAGDSEIVKLLLPFTKNINILGKANNTILNFAAYSNNCELVNLLINNKADANKPNDEGVYPIYWPALNKNLAMLRMLIPLIKNIDVKDSKENTPLIRVIYANFLEGVKCLLDHGADANCSCEDGTLPLFWAIQTNNIEIVKLLLDVTTKIDNVTKKESLTALYEAARLGNIEFVKLLLEKGANANISSSKKVSPLGIAVDKQHFEVVKLLIPYTTDLNEQNFEGDTPLSVAVMKGDKNIVELLLENNADPNIPDSKMHYPFRKAVQSGFFEIAQLLEKLKNFSIDVDKSLFSKYKEFQEWKIQNKKRRTN